jgi:NAD(P)H dehydrogenase (quinone)
MLIIYAHLNKDGYCGYILKKFQSELENKKIEYQLLDLYAEHYDPILKPEEHYTSGHRIIAEDTARYQKLLLENDKFVVIFPTWWNGAPAILKGFFDRTLTNGITYKYVNGIPRGLLKGKAAVFTTTGGNSLLEILFLGNRGLRVVVNDTLRFCGIKAKGFMIGSARKITDKQKVEIDKKVINAINYLK